MTTGKVITALAGVGLVIWGAHNINKTKGITSEDLVGGVLVAGGIYIIYKATR